MDIKPWPKDPTREIAALADEQKRGLSANDRTMILIYERAMKEAYAARLVKLRKAAIRFMASDIAKKHADYGSVEAIAEALETIGELPSQAD